MRKNSPPEGRSANPFLTSSKWAVGPRLVQIVIVCLIGGMTMLYIGNRSIAAIYHVDPLATALEFLEGTAAASLRTVWSGSEASGTAVSAPQKPASSEAATAASKQTTLEARAADSAVAERRSAEVAAGILSIAQRDS